MAQRGLRWLCACAAIGVSLGEPAHTRATPGKWAGKEDTHVPQLIISPEPPSLPVRLVARASVPHSMSPEHHIDEIYVKDQTGAVLGKTTIGPTATAAALSVEVPPISVRLAAFAHCNQHGTWQARAGTGPPPLHLRRGPANQFCRNRPRRTSHHFSSRSRIGSTSPQTIRPPAPRRARRRSERIRIRITWSEIPAGASTSRWARDRSFTRRAAG